MLGLSSGTKGVRSIVPRELSVMGVTGDVYVQTIEESVLAAVNSRTSGVLGDWKMPEKSLGLKGRNLQGLNGIRRSSAKSIGKVAVSY